VRRKHCYVARRTKVNSNYVNFCTLHSLSFSCFVVDCVCSMWSVSFGKVSLCVDDVCRWFLENVLLLNLSKTEAVLFGTGPQRDKVSTAGGIEVAGTLVTFRNTVKLLGVTLDSWTMDRHITEVVRKCNYHIRALQHIRPLLTPDVAKMLAHSIVTLRLDYADALSVWNSVSYNCRSAECFSSFRRTLKTELFDIAYSERKQSAYSSPICASDSLAT